MNELDNYFEIIEINCTFALRFGIQKLFNYGLVAQLNRASRFRAGRLGSLK